MFLIVLYHMLFIMLRGANTCIACTLLGLLTSSCIHFTSLSLYQQLFWNDVNTSYIPHCEFVLQGGLQSIRKCWSICLPTWKLFIDIRLVPKKHRKCRVGAWFHVSVSCHIVLNKLVSASNVIRNDMSCTRNTPKRITRWFLEDVAVNLKVQFSNNLVVSQHLFRYWRHQVIIGAEFDPDLCHHISRPQSFKMNAVYCVSHIISRSMIFKYLKSNRMNCRMKWISFAMLSMTSY